MERFWRRRAVAGFDDAPEIRPIQAKLCGRAPFRNRHLDALPYRKALDKIGVRLHLWDQVITAALHVDLGLLALSHLALLKWNTVGIGAIVAIAVSIFPLRLFAAGPVKHEKLGFEALQNHFC